MPDEVCAHFKELGDYDYRPAREVADAAETTAVRSVIDVDILGHIFEQSITDLERLRHSLEQPRPVVGQCVPPASPSAATPPGMAPISSSCRSCRSGGGGNNAGGGGPSLCSFNIDTGLPGCMIAAIRVKSETTD